MDKKRPKFCFRYVQILTTVVLLLAAVFLCIGNYHFIYSVSDSVIRKQNSYGETVTTRVTDAISNSFDLQLSSLPLLVENSFQETDPAVFETDKAAATVLFGQIAPTLLASFQSINRNIEGIILLTPNLSFGYGEVPVLWRINSNDALCHWGIDPKASGSILMPEDPVFTEDPKLASLDSKLRIVFPFGAPAQNLFFCVLINEDFFTGHTEDVHDIAVLSAYGTVLSNNTTMDRNILNELRLGPPQTDSGKNGLLYHTSDSEKYGFSVLHALDMSSIYRQIWNSISRILLLDLILLVISLFIAGIWGRQLTAPFQSLADRIASYPENGVSFVEKKLTPPRFAIRESIFYYLLAGILPAYILFSALSIPLYNSFANSNQEYSSQSTYRQINKEIRSLFSNAELVATSILLENNIQQAAISDTPLPFHWKPQSIDCFSTAGNIAVYGKSGQLLYYSDVSVFPETELDPRYYNQKRSWSVVTVNHRRFFELFIPFRNVNGLEPIGYLFCRIDEAMLQAVYLPVVSEQDTVCIADQSGTVVSHHKTDSIGTKPDPEELRAGYLKQGLNFASEIPGTPFSFVIFGDISGLQKEQTEFLIRTLYLCVLVLIVVLLTSTVLAKYISGLFLNLSRHLYSLAPDSEILLSEEETFIEEANRIHDAFHEMTKRIHQLHEEALQAAERQYRMEQEYRRVEIALLQAQINPHFLCNTFENVNYFIRNNESEKAIRMLETLGAMFRFAARENRELVKLNEETNYARQYTEIMRLRFSDVFTASFDIPDACTDYRVPRFILQPIIENAIIHALIPKGKDGKLTVKCEVTSNRIYLLVIDNGIGMEPAQLEKITAGLQTPATGRSIGLYNIHNRLEMLYGKPFGINIASSPGSGTTVIITLPVRPELPDTGTAAE